MSHDHELERQVYELRKDMRAVQLLLLMFVLAGCYLWVRSVATQTRDVPVSEQEAVR